MVEEPADGGAPLRRGRLRRGVKQEQRRERGGGEGYRPPRQPPAPEGRPAVGRFLELVRHSVAPLP
ncbi:hypothetical protein AB0N23_22340, partial [Streptomyces sp. NPDC052644]